MKNKLYIFLFIAFLALTFMLGSWGLTDSSEARYAEIGKEMFINKDYINPTLLGIKHLHKPPVTYYLTALGYQIFGVHEFAARFFMQVALVFQLFLVFKITLLLYNSEKLAFTAALVYFSMPIAIIAVRTLTTDAYLATFILASIYFWLRYKQQNKVYLLYLFYLFLGLIFETKGPVGFIVPLTFIITHKIINKDKIQLTIHQFLGFLLFLFIAASWYIVAIKNNEGLFDYFFNNQLVERVSQNKFKRGKPFWYYILLLPALGLPWVFYLLSYFKNNLKTIIQKKKTDFILLITFIVLFVVLTISTSKLILYVLPLFFVLAIFSAKKLSKSSEKSIKIYSVIHLILTLLITTTIVVLPFIDATFEVNNLIAIGSLFVFGGLALFLNKKLNNTNYAKPAYLGSLFIVALIFSANQFFKSNELKINSVKPIADFIIENDTNESEVMVYNYLLPSLSFYLNKNITTINHGRYTTQRETQFETNENWKSNLINYFDKNDRSRIYLKQPKNSIYLIKRKKDVFPDTLQVFANKLKHKKEFEKFELYY